MDRAIFIFLIFFIVGLGFASMPMAVSFLVGRSRKGVSPPKELRSPDAPDEVPWLNPKEYADLQAEPYESGMPSQGPWRYLGFEYIIYSILFLIFEVIFIAIFFSLGAWLQDPHRVTIILSAIVAIGVIMIFYALKPRKYLKL